MHLHPEFTSNQDDYDEFMDFCAAWLSDPNDPNSLFDNDFDAVDDDFIDLLDYAEFVDGSSAWELYSSKETMYYYLKDALGSVRGLVTGRYADSDDWEFYNYDIYGNLSIQNEEESVSGNPFLFAGYRFDAESELYHTPYRAYEPKLGRWLQFDPIGYADSMSLYEYVSSSPANYLDPLGLLQRRQVDYLAHQWVPGWKGVKPATREQVRDAIRAIKKQLKEIYPDAGFSNSQDWQDHKDDAALQKIIDEKRNNPNATDCEFWKQFPGSTRTPNTCKQLASRIKGAIDKFKEFGGNLGRADEYFLTAWTMKESTWNSSSSAYGNTSARSKAIGLLQVTAKTYSDYYSRGLFPQDNLLWDKYIGKSWDEKNLANPYRNMIVGLFILQGKNGNSIEDKLSNYYGSNSSAANRSYANKIMDGARYVKEFLNGRNLRDLTQEECDELTRELDKIVH